MAENSKIEWTTHTFNPWFGCTKVSPGCDNCYAEHMMDTRMHKVQWGAGKPRVRTSDAYWRQPMKWNKEAAARGVRPRVFCASLGDVFDNEVPDEWRADLFRLIADTPNLDWLLLTKRIGNAQAMIEQAMASLTESDSERIWDFARYQWKSVWLGATVVNQEEADRDIPKLLATPAAVRFLSIEPILGPISFRWAPWQPFGAGPNGSTDHLDGLRRFDWLIVGGESGPKARPTTIGHIRSVVRQCEDAGVPVFVKQLGRHPVNREGVPHHLRDPKGGDMAEWPADLRLRQFPGDAAMATPQPDAEYAF